MMSKVSKATALSLFAGIGGFEVGMSQCGFEFIKTLEWDTNCCQTLNASRHLTGALEDDIEPIDDTKIPASLATNIGTWKWGSYGWVSPASLIFTAAWRKIYYPEEDCCKIWARDEQNNAIPGGYSIRSEDESISISKNSPPSVASGSGQQKCI